MGTGKYSNCFIGEILSGVSCQSCHRYLTRSGEECEQSRAATCSEKILV